MKRIIIGLLLRLLDSSLQASDVFVSMGGVNPAFSLENNSVSFFVEKPESTKPVEIYFSVAPLIACSRVF